MDTRYMYIAGGLLVFSYLLFKLLNRPNPEFQKRYEEILNSNEHKVKSRFEE
jgi:hypothetical protein